MFTYQGQPTRFIVVASMLRSAGAMDVSEVKVCILRMEGTNNEQEMFDCYHRLGAMPELVHLNQLTRRGKDSRSLLDYHVLMLPGGFSAGDYVRAGAIMAARLRAQVWEDVETFVAADLPVGGTCNGFQVLVEMGLLPGGPGGRATTRPTAVLAENTSGRFECRPIHLRHINKGRCVFTRALPKGAMLTLAVAHREGNLQVAPERASAALRRWVAKDQLVFRYCEPQQGDRGRRRGSRASVRPQVPHPWNPNGAMGDIAGLTNERGTVFGMMPHPERAFYRHQHPDWTRTRTADDVGDGRLIFASALQYVCDTFLP